MKSNFSVTAIAAALIFSLWSVKAADTNTVAGALKDLDHRITAKLVAGEKTEAGYTNELAELDALLKAHRGESQEELAEILNLKAATYKLALHDDAKYDAVMAQIGRDYPDSRVGRQIRHEGEIKKVQNGLAPGTPFPDFDEKDLAGRPLSIAGHKGKVVLIDFWATWCGPCKAELPNVRRIYEQYHSQGFDIIGVSLDQDEARLRNFVSQNSMPWPQFFDGQGWKNKLAVKYGVEAIPATYLVDGDGKIIANDLRGEALAQAVAAALSKK